MNNVKIITIESDFGAGKKGAKLGPQALLKELPKQLLENIPIDIISSSEIAEEEHHEFALHIESILEVENRAIEAIEKAVVDGFRPWIISGDHSNGLAAISAYKNLYPKNNLGVIWIDAHADIHTPYTSPSGNMHGMPLAAALGITNNKNSHNKVDKQVQSLWKEMIELGSKKIAPKLNPKDLVFIDIRDLEVEETNEIKELEIKHFLPANRKDLGIKGILQETLEHLSHCHHILVSFDVDSMDPSISSGTGTPVHDGLSRDEAVELLSGFLSIPNLFSFEITEINPLLDRHNPMEIAAANVLEETFKRSTFF